MSDDLTQNLPTSQDGTLAQILTTVQNLDSKVQSIDTRLENLEQRFGSLEQKVEERLYDTRPIWEKVQADIARLQEGQDALRSEVHEMNKEQRNTGRKLSVINDGLLKMQADHRDLDDRVRGLEGPRS